VRVIGGNERGRRLVAPDLPTLRPTSDRVREAMFDILEARGLVEEARVLDLFAGSGALGIEALSRGAAAVTFVERDPRAVRAIQANLDSLGYSGPDIRVVRAEAESWLEVHRRAAFDLLLADPPYGWEGWRALFEHAGAAHVLVEHRQQLEAGGHYEILREYRYGGTLVTLMRDKRQDDAATSTPDGSGPEPGIDKDSL
jgi:16S rRNA (guanine(966)-N(2))-methyltransferase RsmD